MNMIVLLTILAIVLPIISGVIFYWLGRRDRREELQEARISRFVDKAVSLRLGKDIKGFSLEMRVLLGAGITELKNYKEIKRAIKQFYDRTSINPFGDYQDLYLKYNRKLLKKFFEYIAQGRIDIYKVSPEEAIELTREGRC